MAWLAGAPKDIATLAEAMRGLTWVLRTAGWSLHTSMTARGCWKPPVVASATRR
jgi:hypothetical protein